MLTNAPADLHHVRRLMLQIERNLLKQSCLETILQDARTTVAGHRQELRTLRTRMARDRAAKPKTR
jgi:hypothetical protein